MTEKGIAGSNQEPSPAEKPDEKLFSLQLEEQALKIDELKLKVADLKKPEYKKFNFWTSTFAIVIALGGIVGQNILSSIKSERAELEVKQAENKKDSAERWVREAENTRDSARKELQIATQEYEIVKRQIDSAKYTIELINLSVNRLKESTETDSIKTLINKTQNQLGEIPPRVYIQIANENQRSIAKTLQGYLIKNNFLVPGIENVTKLNAKIPGKTEVRYYRDEEREEAITIIKILQALQIGEPINETPQKIPGNGRGTRLRHFEIWFTGF